MNNRSINEINKLRDIFCELCAPLNHENETNFLIVTINKKESGI